jgi:FixJ family two-component response regulator
MVNYTAFVLDDDEGVREVCIDLLKSLEFSVQGFQTAEELLSNLFPSAVLELSELPDLIVVDLQLLDSHMQGPDLIQELAQRDIPSQILAISGFVPTFEFADKIMLFGAAVLLPKPFTHEVFGSKAKRLARIGYKKRMKKIRELNNRFEPIDAERNYRPVFLSYANEDINYATGIRRHVESCGIDVWYAPTTLELGQHWRKKIDEGIKNAHIFIAILSDFFVESEICMLEINRFRNQIQKYSDKQLLFLPIMVNLSSTNQSCELVQWIKKTYHYQNLLPRIADCLTSLIYRIQGHLAKVNQSY